jgi:hypothetical protein
MMLGAPHLSGQANQALADRRAGAFTGAAVLTTAAGPD